MTIDEMISVMEAYKQGKSIEFRLKKNGQQNEWNFVEIPCWNWSYYEYRVRETKPSINWDHVSPKYNYLAVDEDDEAFLFEAEPEWGYGSWSPGGDYSPADSHISFESGNCSPENSLVERPKGK